MSGWYARKREREREVAANKHHTTYALSIRYRSTKRPCTLSDGTTGVVRMLNGRRSSLDHTTKRLYSLIERQSARTTLGASAPPMTYDGGGAVSGSTAGAN